MKDIIHEFGISLGGEGRVILSDWLCICALNNIKMQKQLKDNLHACTHS